MNDLLVAYARGFEWKNVQALANQLENSVSAGLVHQAFCDKLFAQGHFEEARECCQVWLKSFALLPAETNKKEYQIHLKGYFILRPWKDLSAEFGKPKQSEIFKLMGTNDDILAARYMRCLLKSTQIFKARVALSIIDYCIEINADGASNPLMKCCRDSRKTQSNFSAENWRWRSASATTNGSTSPERLIIGAQTASKSALVFVSFVQMKQ